jgi:hypothetical protein
MIQNALEEFVESFPLDVFINEPLRIAKEQVRILLNRRAKLALSRPHPSASSTALPSVKEKDHLFSRTKKKGDKALQSNDWESKYENAPLPLI